MSQPIRIIIYILLAVVVIHLLFDIFGTHSNIKSVIRKLEKSQDNLNNAMKEIDSSQKRLGLMQEDLQKFSAYVKDIQGQVELSDSEKKLKEATSIKVKDSLRKRINVLKEELLETDTLPEIIIK